jgi:hypothetical protein
MRKKALVVTELALVLLVLPWFQCLSRGTTVLKLDRQELTRRASRIVIGSVQSASSRWNTEKTSISTLVTISVERTLKGAESSRVQVIVPGGEVGGIGQKATGAPTFSPGEKVFLFLDETSPGLFRTVGFFQGKFDIREEGTPSAPFVISNPNEALYDPATREYVPVKEEKIPLDTFIAEILSYLR